MHLTMPMVGTGLSMALYLLLRPYGDTGTPTETATAFASNPWVIAHLFGALALVSFALLAQRLAHQLDTAVSRLARSLALAGTALTLLYYGAETFALHILGRAAIGSDPGQADPALVDPAVLELADQIRFQPAAVAVFAIGLLAISAAAVMMAIASRSLFRPGWTIWPLALVMALFPAQFYLPVAGRIGFGVLAAAAAVIAVLGVHTSGASRTVTQSGLSRSYRP